MHTLVVEHPDAEELHYELVLVVCLHTTSIMYKYACIRRTMRIMHTTRVSIEFYELSYIILLARVLIILIKNTIVYYLQYVCYLLIH